MNHSGQRFRRFDGQPGRNKAVRIGLGILAMLLLGALIGCRWGTTDEPAAATTPVVIRPTATTAPIAAATPVFEPDMGMFETVWQTVADGFYDPNMNGIDWQAVHDRYQPQVAAAQDELAYYLKLNDMLFELGVSHIGVLPPWAADELDPITFPAGSLGLDVRLLGEEIVVTAVQPDSTAASAGLQPGFVIKRVDGQTALELAQETLQAPVLNEQDRRGMITQAVRARLYGEPGELVTIAFLDADDQPGEVSLAYGPRPAKQVELMPHLPPAYVEFSASRLEPAIGYLRFSGFLQGVDAEVAAALKEMGDTESLIIDLRGNPGGVFPVRKAIAEKLVGERVLFWQYQTREGLDRIYLNVVPNAYQGKLVILIDELSASSSEEFSGGLQAIGRATIVGGRSPGRCLTAEILPLESGAILVYPHGQSQTADGYVLEKNGVIPDIAVELDRASLLVRRDLQLEAAILAAGGG